MSRQKIMLAVVGVLLVLQGGDWALTNLIEGPMQVRQAQRAQLEKRIKDRKAELARVRSEGKVLDVWEAQSLPSNPDAARTLYRAWLQDLVTDCRLEDRNVDAGSAVNHRGLYKSINCSVRGRGSMQTVTNLLYKFYNAPHLHRIQSVSLKPRTETSKVDVAMTVEALILPTATRKDELAKGKMTRLASAQLEDYDPFIERNVFGFPTKAGIDPAQYAYLTAIIASNGEPQAWFTLRNADKVLKRSLGQEISVGDVSATIVEIMDSEVVLGLGEERWLLTVGENLTEAFALPPEH
jgi:hypothetical protein